MKQLSILTLILIFIITGINDVEAQKKRRKSRTDKTEDVNRTSFTENIYYDIKIGNFGIGSSFQIATKPVVGYKFTKLLSANLAFENRYTFINSTTSSDQSFFDFAVGPGVRLKVSETIFLGAEYLYNSIDLGNARFNAWGTGIGGGYFSGYGDWKFGIEVMFMLNDNIRDIEGLVGDYWFGATYNF